MPQIRRVRFVNVGNERARMEDLTLEMHDAGGTPTDTALWLDNGGGKSSMLALFFSLMRPSLKEFLGVKAEQKLRKLEHYVGAQDHSLVLAEWDLDATDLAGERQRLVIGAFMERAERSGEDVKFDRTWFAFRVVPDEPGFTLDRLPVYEDGETSGTRRYTRSGFKMRMAELHAETPASQYFVTDVQSEWIRYLDELGIDTELFLYQILMNQREGGAADLFKFRDVEDFVDFFVRVVLGEESGQKLGETLLGYRDDLKRRQRFLVPERRLVGGIADRVRQMVDVREQRDQMTSAIQRIAGAAAALRGHIEAQVAAKREEAATLTAEAERELRMADRVGQEATDRYARAVVADAILAEVELGHAQARQNELEEQFEWATRDHQIAGLAVPLARAKRHRAEAQTYAELLEIARSEAAPLLEKLRSAATEYAGVLLARIEGIDTEARGLIEQADAAQDLAERMRNEARAHESVAAREAERARSLAQEEKLAEADLEHHRARGDVHEDEDAASAQARWEARLQDSRSELVSTDERIADLDEQVRVRANQVSSRRDELREAERDLITRRAALGASMQERAALELDELILGALRTDRLDLDRIEDAQVALVAKAAEQEQTALFGLWSEDAQAKHILRRLDGSGLLPPSRDAEAVVALLAPQLQMAVSGWEYASQALSIASGAARAFVEAKPHIATGVVVRDTEFERACQILAGTNLDLDAPIVVAPQSAVHAEGRVEGYVLAPTTDAHFDPAAGERERSERREHLDEFAVRIREAVARLEALRERAFRIADFRSRHPRGHFVQAQEQIDLLADRFQSDQERLAQMEGDLADLQERLETERRTRETLGGQIAEAERAIERITGHLRRFGSDPAGRKRERIDAEKRAAETQRLADTAHHAAGEAAQTERARRQEASALREGRGELNNALRGITDVDEEALRPLEGDLDALRNRYTTLRSQYAREVNETGLEQLRTREVQEINAAESEYEEGARKLLESQGTSRVGLIFHGITQEKLRADVEAFIESAPRVDRLQQRLQELATDASSAAGRMGRGQQDVTAATERRDKTAKDRAELEHQPLVEFGQGGVPKEPAELTRWVAAEFDEAGSLANSVEEHAGKSREAQHRAELAGRDADRLAGQMETLGAVVENNASLLGRAADAPPPLSLAPPQSEAGVSTRIAKMRQDLKRLRADDEALDELRDGVHQDLLGWIAREEFQEVVTGNPMLRDLQAHTPAALEAAASMLTDRLEVRIQNLDRTLAAIDEYRSTLIGLALNAAEKGIQALEGAQQISRMPAHMPRFGSKHFLKVRHRAPEAEDGRRERMAALVDDIIASDTNPSGIEMVQRAVRALGRPFRIEIMFPDRTRGAWYTEVERLGRDSGGEVLTSAILLYCNLARLRARNRGRLASPTSVLMLDNPFGSASRLSFLEVQLEVARAAGVQLVYTTGVKDYDAISLFPNINRVRPSGFDARHRQWLLARTDIIRTAEGMDMARMVRGEVARAAAEAPVA
jgi:hypothetical protein